MFFLVDCNNFYASCERVFDPRLRDKPVVVLSNNDGCVIARSKEAKHFGVPMGVPAFQCKDLFQKHNIKVLSSNYKLYGDMSRRFFEVLQTFCPDVEIYSIDEAFLKFKSHDTFVQNDWFALGKKIRETLYQWLGIPVSVGIGPTKTLAKLSTELIKNLDLKDGVFELFGDERANDYLELIDIADVWGVGRRYANMLKSHSVKTALDLKNLPPQWIRKKMTVMGSRMQSELHGVSCVGLEEIEPVRKSIVCSRSFGRAVLKKQDLEEALATYIARGAEKLRQRKLLAGHVSIFLKTSQYESHHKLSSSISLEDPTNFTPDLIQKAFLSLDKIYKKGLRYKKAGVMFYDLVLEKNKQYHLFQNEEKTQNHEKAMQVLDQINKKWGRKTLQCAAEGIKKDWQMRKNFSSPAYTTSWKHLLKVKARAS